ncbi:MAG TPA: zinc ribbon domain-containing protein [Phycisphaeraceae bacterium]
MNISAIEPISRAWDTMVRVLFKPMEVRKWLTLGFCAFLAYLGGVGGGHIGVPGGGGGGGSGGGTQGSTGAGDWVQSHLILVAGIVIGVLAVMLALVALVHWLQSRGKFMFLDGVAHNRGRVVQPWKEHRALGNSLFRFQMLMLLLMIAAVLATLAVCGALSWAELEAGRFGQRSLAAMVLLVVMATLIALAYLTVQLLVEDFMVPAMYRQEITAREAWRRVWGQVIRGHLWPVTLFYLMRYVLSMAASMLVLMTCCMTCGLVLLPYVGTVVILPILVFQRAYSLHFLEQYGSDWRVFPLPDAPMCPACGYDLRGNPDAITCPECGEPLTQPQQA